MSRAAAPCGLLLSFFMIVSDCPEWIFLRLNSELHLPFEYSFKYSQFALLIRIVICLCKYDGVVPVYQCHEVDTP